ncbi:MarR family winged helix-turn-helix transcriptional regulator [Sporosarcina cyprini]|uniref:MarR family winged helix-turn-helix transcriptional regulator n=1 Tax=Sporosarcina cyprini TaxID=2910523 RepID=UPI001EE02C8B|nr:MarR family transcriptional regulator [Sporosarcina cyprini]MCG3088355.1 MarR family transcriptional regulator [Sporosarcina cyprini]
MKEETIFEIIHNMDKFTNNLIIQWNKTFNEELGVSHILLLGHLMVHGKSRPSDIAKVLGLTPPTVTHLTEKLVKKNLAVRSTDEEDRRIVYLSISDAGIEIVKRANLEGQVLRKKLFEKLSPEEQQQMLRIYKKLNS